MKKQWIVVCTALALASCTTKEELSEQQAATLIRQQMHYPKEFSYDVFCADPEYAKKAMDAGLEANGLVRIKRTQKVSQAGQPLIEFTDIAKPYLLATPNSDRQTNIQKVKIADQDLEQISKITMDEDGSTARVEYTTSFKNTTPFSLLLHTDLHARQSHTASLIWTDNQWKLKNRKD